MVGAVIIIVVLVIIVPVGILMSGAIGAAVLGSAVKKSVDTEHAGSELLAVSEAGQEPPATKD